MYPSKTLSSSDSTKQSSTGDLTNTLTYTVIVLFIS